MDDLLPGGLYRQTHQASVRAILGDDAPPIHSHGRQFFNVGRWVWRIFPGKMFTWARENPGQTPDRDVIEKWVWGTNVTAWPEAAIHIASTPDELDWTTALALTGGIYHETFHSLYSRTRDLFIDEVYTEVTSRWDKANWSAIGAMAEEALQYIEDVRIEQRGSDEHPGVYQPLCDLQDFILDMEEEGLAQARAHEEQKPGEKSEPWSELSTLMAAFRDLGLGYDTPAGRAAIQRYREMHPDVLALVETGPVSPLVERAASMSPSDDLGCIWLAMDLIILMQQMAESEAKSPQEKQQQQAAQIILLLGEGSGSEGFPGLLRAGDALEQALAQLLQTKHEEAEDGEQPWRPLNPSLDRISMVPEGVGAETVLEEVYGQVSFLRARLQQVIRTMALTGTEHGVRRGRHLSERTLVETYISVRNRLMPTRAFKEDDEEISTSLAAAVVLDQSSSMSTKRETATKTMMALTEPLDTLRYPVMVAGFRDRYDPDAPPPPDGWENQYHRVDGIHYDVFKRFDERFHDVLGRFTSTKAVHLTPMSDGIQFGLKALRTRRETHRLLFVVTDGYPTGRHARVVRWQIRTARAEGIYIVGVGIGEGSKGVVSLFDDYVYCEALDDMPEALLRKLNDLLDFRKVTRLTA